MENATRVRRQQRFAAIAMAAGAILAASTAAQAITIYAMDNLGTANAGTVGDRFIRFDSTSPNTTVTVLGSTGISVDPLMSGLDFTPNGNLYSVNQPSAGGGNLYRINTANGAATLVGSLGLPTGTTAGFQITDLSYNPVTGQMLGLGVSLFTSPARVHRLYNINVTTGAATSLGDITGLPSGALDVGMASNSAGVNFLHNIADDRMYSLAGLVATPMPSVIGIDTNFSQGMVINHQGANEWFLGAIGPSVSPFTSQVMLINNVTGAGTTVPNGVWPTHAANGLPEYETGDLAIPPAVPEPASMGLFAAGALAATLRRRRTS